MSSYVGRLIFGGICTRSVSLNRAQVVAINETIGDCPEVFWDFLVRSSGDVASYNRLEDEPHPADVVAAELSKSHGRRNAYVRTMKAVQPLLGGLPAAARFAVSSPMLTR